MYRSKKENSSNKALGKFNYLNRQFNVDEHYKSFYNFNLSYNYVVEVKQLIDKIDKIFKEFSILNFLDNVCFS